MCTTNINCLKEVEDENRNLRQVFADLSLKNRVLKDMIYHRRKSINWSIMPGSVSLKTTRRLRSIVLDQTGL